MKKYSFYTLLVALFTLGCSFSDEVITDETILFKIENGYAIRIDGFRFDARSTGSSEAYINKDSGKDGQLTAHVTFWGNETKTRSGSYNPQKIDMAFSFNEANPTQVQVSNLVFEFNRKKYVYAATETQMSISRLQWTDDRKNILVTGEFTTKVQAPTNDGPVVMNMRGKVENLQIQVPAEVLQNLPKPTTTL